MSMPQRLLLVDDDADDRHIFREAVQQIDPSIECILANDGLHGLSYLSDENNPLPAYIFLDLRMHGIDGRKLLRIIKENPRLKNIPVMIYTTSTDEVESKELVEMGATHFTSKPADPDELFYVLSVILGEKWT